MLTPGLDASDARSEFLPKLVRLPRLGLKLAAIIALIMGLTSATIWAQEWQAVPEDQLRLNSVVLEPPVTLPDGPEPDSEDIVEKPPVSIDGAFGLYFEQPIPKKNITQQQIWARVDNLPGRLYYGGETKPFTMPKYKLDPPEVPNLLKSTSATFLAYVDFDANPLWFRAENVTNLDAVIEILKRKYGEPDRETEGRIEFHRGSVNLEVLSDGNRGVLNYYHIDRFRPYLKERGRRLKQRFKNPDRSRLTPQEITILTMADELTALNEDISNAFGIRFGHRVGFRAKPDEFSSFKPRKPLKSLHGGAYKIMVSPDLLPISLRYEKQGNGAALLAEKAMLDKALEISFGGFVKQTARHTVLSLDNMTLSIMVRHKSLLFSVHDSRENKAFYRRDKAAKAARREALALALAEKEAAVTRAELEKEAALVLAQREKELAEERGF